MRKKRKPKETGRIGNTLIALVAIVLALYGFVAYKAIQTKPSKQAKPGGQTIPAYYRRAEEAMPLPPTLDPAKFKGQTFGQHTRWQKKSLKFSRNSLATAIASGKGTADCSTVSAHSTLPPAPSASRKRCLLARCTVRGKPPNRSGRQSFRDSGQM